MSVELGILRLIHIVGGSIWVGSAVFSLFFLAPALAKAGPAAGTIFAEFQRRRLFTFLPVIATLTMLSGLRLIAMASNGFGAPYFGTPAGLTYAAAGACSIVAFFLSLLVSRPSVVRAARLQEASLGAPDASPASVQQEIASLRRRGDVATRIATILLIIGAGGMAVARYL